ncbi:helix-turn-helix domain-containing protein [Micromonospora soli]|uniref:TrmB family transcriptional regulator n=1 Tax=Micromonospora sp. NBRC 110009 TaxID=3061627 RepID=UPI0026717A4F|nr:helix-turn-helix domain-containing protein [Micromonospora sp. NBRC 110009]WKU00403.1 helix-turn-helix domain-containing protein [Micromonospora sp. NBRC 110009]
MTGVTPLVDALIGLGLTQYAARAYLALVTRDRYTAAELARASGVPRQRIYDVLNSLSERGLVRVRPGPVVRYAAVDPEAAVNRMMTVHRTAYEQRERTGAELVDQLAPLWTRGRSEDDPLDYVEVIRDRDLLAERFAELQSSARHQLLTLAKLPYLVVENPTGLEAARRLSRAGGDVRCVYEHAMLDNHDMVDDVRGFLDAGERARLVAEVPMRLCIADGARVLMSMRDPRADEASSTSLLIEHPALAQLLIQAYETIWSGGEDFASAVARAGVPTG